MKQHARLADHFGQTTGVGGNHRRVDLGQYAVTGDSPPDETLAMDVEWTAAPASASSATGASVEVEKVARGGR